MFLICYYNDTDKKPKKTNDLNMYYYSRFKYSHCQSLLGYQFQETLTDFLYTYCLSGRLQQGDEILSVNGESFQGITNDRCNIWFCSLIIDEYQRCKWVYM